MLIRTEIITECHFLSESIYTDDFWEDSIILPIFYAPRPQDKPPCIVYDLARALYFRIRFKNSR